MKTVVSKKGNKILSLIFVIVCIAATATFSVLFGIAVKYRNASGMSFPVNVSQLNLASVCKNGDDYVIGTESGEILYYSADDYAVPLWSFSPSTENDEPAPPVVTIKARRGRIYAAFANRRIYVFPADGSGAAQPEKTYVVGLTPVNVYFGGDDVSLFAVYGETSNRKGLYFFRTDAEGEEISYADHSYLNQNNGLGNGLTDVLIDGDDALYFTTETAEIVRTETSGTGGIAADDVTTVYEGENNFLALEKIDGGYAAIDRLGNLTIFDSEMKPGKEIRGSGETLTDAYFIDGKFLLKAKSGAFERIDLNLKKEFSIAAKSDDRIVFVSAEGFGFVNGKSEFFYSDESTAKKKEYGEKTFGIYLAFAIVFLAASVFSALSLFENTWRKFTASLKKACKTAYKYRVAYLSLIPTFVLLAVFYWTPIVSSLVLSFFDYLPKEKMQFVGLDNIMSVIRNTEFWFSFKNTLIFLVTDLLKAIVPPILFAEFLIALRSKKTSYWIRVLMFLPGIIPGVAGMLVWADGIFGSSSSGLLNGFLSAVLPSFVSKAWLMNSATALPCLIFIGFPWVGQYLIFFGAISGLPPEMFEAAKLDGCGWWKKITAFDLPLIVPQIKYIFITTFISSVQNYTMIYIATGGDYNTNTPALMMYYAISVQKNYGIASAMGLFLFIFLIGATAINFKMQFGQSDD